MNDATGARGWNKYHECNPCLYFAEKCSIVRISVQIWMTCVFKIHYYLCIFDKITHHFSILWNFSTIYWFVSTVNMLVILWRSMKLFFILISTEKTYALDFFIFTSIFNEPTFISEDCERAYKFYHNFVVIMMFWIFTKCFVQRLQKKICKLTYREKNNQWSFEEFLDSMSRMNYSIKLYSIHWAIIFISFPSPV